jgi:SAM-dependent methyltransferase
MPNLQLRQADIVAGPVERGTFDLVTARAVLHHVVDPEAAMANMVASLKAGGTLLLIEPDFLPVSVAEPPEVRAFWDGWLAWSRERGIDYQIGADTCASTRLGWPNEHQWHSGDRGLQQRLVVGKVLD